MTDIAPIPAAIQAALAEACPAPNERPEPVPLIPPTSQSEPFPLEALGGRLTQAAETIRDATQSPDALAGQCVLAAAALGVQGHFDVVHPLGHAVPCSLLLIASAESGERKSTVDRLALRPFRAAEEGALADYGRDYADWRAAIEARDAKRSHIKAKRGAGSRTWREIQEAIAALGPDPSPPLSPVRIVADPNFEGLVKFAAIAQGSLGWFSNEAGMSIGGTAMHNENRLKFGAGLSMFWDGQPVDRIRAGDGAQSLRGRRLTVNLMVQPEIAAPFLSDRLLRAQGWLSRALICEPPTNIGQRPWRNAADLDTGLSAYEQRLAALIERPLPHAAEAENQLTPHPLPWTPAARTMWVGFHDMVEVALGAGQRLEEHRGFGAKLAENAARIATVLAGFAGAASVDDDAMGRAIKIADFYVGETVRHRDAAAVSQEMRLAQKALAWLRDPVRWKKSEITLRDVMQFGSPPGVRPKPAAEALVATLLEYGWLFGPARGPWAIWGRN